MSELVDAIQENSDHARESKIQPIRYNERLHNFQPMK